MGWFILGSIFALLFVAFPFWVIREDRRQWRESVEADKKWLKAQEQLPKYQVSFTLMTGTVKKTRLFNPLNTNPGSDFNMRVTSMEAALEALAIYYERGYFSDEEGPTYPLCQVASAAITRQER